MNLSATKKLMRALRAKGVEIKRGPRAGLFEDALGGKRIPVIEIPKKSSIGVLWHEAGHHVARRAATVNKGKVAAARDVLREQGVTGKAHDTVEITGRLRRERNANRAALKVMGLMKVPPEMQQKFKKVATKGYGTYRGQRYVKEVVPAAELRKKAWEFNRIDSRRVEMSGVIGYEGGVPLTGKVARDRWVKKLRDEDLDRRDANLGRAGAAGAVAGAMIPSRKLGLYRRMGIGAVAGTLGVLAVRQATKRSKDPYGERSRAAKRAEAVPAAAGLTVAGVQAARKLGLLRKLKMQSAERRIVELAAYIEDVAVKNLPAAVRKDVARFVEAKAAHKVIHYGIVAKELVAMADANNLATARANVRKMSAKRAASEVRNEMQKGTKFVLVMNGRVVDGHHFIAKAERGKVTSSLDVLDLTPLRFQQFSRRSRRVIELAKKDERKRGLNPYVGAAASGAVSGAGLGFLPMILRRGTSLKAALKAGAVGGLASGAIVGGGALLGSKIVGKPREDEGAAFTKRAAIGGTIAGAGVGLAGGLALRKTRGGARMLVKASKQWRPAMWMRQGRGHGGLASAAAIGAVGGGVYGGATGADEGQQVDSIRHLRKDLRQDVKRAATRLSSRVASVQFSVGRVKDWRDARRESRGAAWRDAGMGTGALLAGAGVGAGAGYAGFRVGRAAKETQAVAGRVNGAMNAAVSGKHRIVRASQWMKRQLTTFPTLKKLRMMNAKCRVVMLAGRPLAKGTKPMRHVREVIADMNRRPPSWNKGAANKVKNFLRWLEMESREAGVHEFRELTPEQEQMRRRAMVTGGVALPVSAVGYAGFRSLRSYKETQKERDIRAGVIRAQRAVAGMPVPRTTKATSKAAAGHLREARKMQTATAAANAKTMGRAKRLAAIAALAKFRMKHNFSGRLGLVMLDIAARNMRTGQSAGYKAWVENQPIVDRQGNPMKWTAPMAIRHSINEGRKVGRAAQRTSRLARDVAEVAQGKKSKKREWEKAWFRNTVATAVGGAAMLGHGYMMRTGVKRHAPKWMQNYRGTYNKVKGRVHDAKEAAIRRADDLFLAARVRRLIALDYYDPAQMHGWDMRDVRGRSARVFAPGARKRMRREAKWHEKKDGQRKILGGLAVAGAVAGLGGGILIGRKIPPKSGGAGAVAAWKWKRGARIHTPVYSTSTAS